MTVLTEQNCSLSLVEGKDELFLRSKLTSASRIRLALRPEVNRLRSQSQNQMTISLPASTNQPVIKSCPAATWASVAISHVI